MDNTTVSPDEDKLAASQFPDVDIPNNQKGESYHKAALLNLVKQSFWGSPYVQFYNEMLSNYQYYFGVQEMQNLFGATSAYNVNNVTIGGDSENFVMPTQVVNYNGIKTRIDLLMGESINRGFEFDIKTIGIDVESERDKIRKEVIAKLRMRGINEMMAGVTGIPLGLDGEMPVDEDDIQDYVDRTYRDILGSAMKECLKYSYEENIYEETRQRMLLDMWVTNRCCAVRKVLNGRDILQYVSPFNVFIDPNAEGSHLSNARYFLVGRYMSVAEAMQEYKITPDEVKKVRGRFFGGAQLAFNGVWGTWNGQRRRYLAPFLDRDTVFAIDAYWLDTKWMYCKVIKDNYGNEQVIKVSEENAKLRGKEKKDGDIVRKQWGCVRKCSLIGGDVVKNWGELEDQEYDVDNLQKAYLPLQMLMPNFIQGYSVSKVWELKNMQDAKNIAMWKIQHEMVKMGGITIDTALIPKEWGKKGVKIAAYYAKVLGMKVINSLQEGNPAASQQNGQMLGLSKDVFFYLDFVRQLDSMMSQTSGTSEVAMGGIANNQLASVTQAAMLQHDRIVEIYFSLFQQFEQRLWTGMTRTIKIAYQQNPERYKAIMGENNYAIIESMGKDIDLSDYSVFIKIKPAMLRNRQMFDATIQQMMGAGQLDAVTGLDLLTTSDMDLDAAIRKFKKVSKKNAAAAAQMQQQMQMQQAQMSEAMLQQKLNAEVQKSVMPAQIAADAQMKKAQMTLQGKVLGDKSRQDTENKKLQMQLYERMMPEMEDED